jgi:hypothetical protein
MIEQPAPNADYLDRPEVRSKLRARPVATYLGARRGVIGYAILVAVVVASAVDAWRYINLWLGVALSLVAAHAVFDWILSWYRVASLAYHRAVEQAHRDRPARDLVDDRDPTGADQARRDPPGIDGEPGPMA